MSNTGVTVSFFGNDYKVESDAYYVRILMSSANRLGIDLNKRTSWGQGDLTDNERFFQNVAVDVLSIRTPELQQTEEVQRANIHSLSEANKVDFAYELLKAVKEATRLKTSNIEGEKAIASGTNLVSA